MKVTVDVLKSAAEPRADVQHEQIVATLMFRKSTGKSPHQFVLHRRVERAKEMLRTAEARVLDVAVACGFKTQQHFARVFRRVCGTSPTEYRQELLR